jgi:hypothetical protein
LVDRIRPAGSPPAGRPPMTEETERADVADAAG